MGRMESRFDELGLRLPAPLVPPGNFQLVTTLLKQRVLSFLDKRRLAAKAHRRMPVESSQVAPSSRRA
ncbi:MAG TPA: hypothetical protein VE440_07825 [Gaiellaceae bacterium]|nr:hypothetical protein [Gaiellaceae bacterium]